MNENSKKKLVINERFKRLLRNLKKWLWKAYWRVGEVS
jgi:hypothetical protein